MAKTKMAYDQAKVIADEAIGKLSKDCERIEIAGSLRRKKEEIGDIEIVAIPRLKSVVDMFGNIYRQVSLLDVTLPGKLIKGGDLYKQYDLGPITLDLFLTTLEKWGVIFTIRTGSADFSHRLVKARKYGGLCPSNLHFKDGRIWDGESALETPEEADVFKALHIDWIEPEKRTA